MQPRRRIEAARRERGLLLVEDCAHVVPDPDSPGDVGSWGEVAVFSLRKLVPVPDGGILV